jgi:hypothetical protein
MFDALVDTAELNEISRRFYRELQARLRTPQHPGTDLQDEVVDSLATLLRFWSSEKFTIAL